MTYDNDNGLVSLDGIREEVVVRLPDDSFNEEENDKYGYYGVEEASKASKGLKNDESILITYSRLNNYIFYVLKDGGVKALYIRLGNFISHFKSDEVLFPEEIAERAINIVDEKDNNKGDEE